ncbi:MAG: tail fiber domain-containing protein [Proteobacteria bacterium]|nr:tail fiber domain-containing protein [Pseudomonadota bacterium]
MKIKTLISAISLSLALPALAGTEATVLNNELELSGMKGEQSYQLRLNLPGKELKTVTLQPTEAIRFTAGDFDLTAFPDGHYKYELVPFNAAQKMVRGDDQSKAGITSSNTEKISGTFTVKNGQSVVDQDEQGDNRDQVILDDLIVDGSACIGFDCVNGESFGFDTIRLKENNLRIKFQDTSTSASFPSNDWELTANDSTNGGGNYFGITDATSGQRPFSVEAGANNHSLYVESTGDIGFGTSTPVVKNHLVDGDTPTVRLEQNGSFGWTPQTWDVAGNEANFFIRDATNGSTLPFRIRPGAPTSSIDIAANGNVGIGTSSPTKLMHLRTSTGSVGMVFEKGQSGEQWKFVSRGNDFQISKIGTGVTQFEVTDASEMSVGNNFVMDASGNVTIQGTLSENSNVHIKENIMAVNPAEVLDKVMGLPISVWNYKFDSDNVKHLGPMAQDFFNAFSLGASKDKIATLDTSGVALASIKALGEKLNSKEAELEAIKQENKALNARLEAIEAMLKKQ